MVWPTVAVVTTNLDAGTDSPAAARANILDAVSKQNQMMAHVSTFGASLLDDASAAAARATLGAAASGANTDITSITGNAATATKLSGTLATWPADGVIANVVGQLAWKSQGAGHAIFDASASTAPSGGAVGNANASVAWVAGTGPTLMGWNGASTYGVRVDSARVADSDGQHLGVSQTWQDFTGSRLSGATHTNSTGRPIYVSIVVVGTGAAQGSLTVGGVVVASSMVAAVNSTNQYSFIVPNLGTYLLNLSAGSISKWTELR